MQNSKVMDPNGRSVGGTENSWCSAVPGGTGIAVLAILTSKFQHPYFLQNALHKLQNSHPILSSKLHFNPNTNAFTFINSPPTSVKIKAFDLSTTLKIIENDRSMSPFHVILEHELNENSWLTKYSDNSADLFFASNYALPDSTFVVVLRLHVSACDRTTAVSLLRELLVLIGKDGEEEQGKETVKKEEGSLGIESLIPHGMAKKGLLARGIDVLSYSMDSFRLTNLKFKDVKSARSSQVVRLQMDEIQTQKLIAGCKKRGIKVCGALVASGLIAAHTISSRNHKQNKYGVITLTDCRPLLHPPLSPHIFGSYHSAILNTHVIRGGEKLWELATKMYHAFSSYKKSNKHFTDMADLNFLMCKAIANPGLTSSSSLRTSFMSVFEDTVIDNTRALRESIGVDDYMGCASVHGIGPSIALFDTIRDGRLDCVCVYPAPLHSRDQMIELIGNMKSVLVKGCSDVLA